MINYKNINFLKKIAISYFTLSIVAIILSISYQALDQDVDKLDKDWNEQNQSIKELKDGLNKNWNEQNQSIKELKDGLQTELIVSKREATLTTYHPEVPSPTDDKILELKRMSFQQYLNDIEYRDLKYASFIEDLDLIQKESDKIKILQERVYGEKDNVKYIFGSIVALGLILFIIILNAVRERTKQRMKDKKEWFNATAHQLRKSVIPLRMGINSLLRLDLTKSESDKILKIIKNDAKQLENLTNKMLDLYKIGEVESIIKKDLDIESLVKQVIEDSKFLNTKELKISHSLESKHKTISGDLIYAEQAIKNLIDNAIGFSYPKGAVLVKVIEKGNNIVVDVIDQGAGIQDNYNVTGGMFRPTRRTGENGSVGHGLGLKLVKRIMKLHDGEFDINNNKGGKGVTATLKFPI